MIHSAKTETKRDYLVLDSQVNADGVHQWPFDAVCPVDVVEHLLSGRRPFRMNRHDYFEIVDLHSGKLIWQIQDQFVRQRKGELFVMGNGNYHRVTERSSPQVSVESLFFHPDLIRSSPVPGDDSEYLSPFQVRDSTFPHVILPPTGIPKEVHELISRLQKELPAQSERARLCVKTYVKMILVLLLNHYITFRKVPKRFDRRQRAGERFKPLFDLLDHHYPDPITPADAAATLNMSSSHFRRAFKQVTGQSFVLYLNHFRIAKAQELLLSTSKPIAEVGLDVGFCDQSYFGLVFRRLSQMTPRQYRERAQQSQREKSLPFARQITPAQKTESITYHR